jgi:hypothetical protein
MISHSAAASSLEPAANDLGLSDLAASCLMLISTVPKAAWTVAFQ